jgi:hypothetical protein
MSQELDDMLDEAAALIALAEFNVPADIQELLLRGDAMRGIPPGALRAAIKATREQDLDVEHR